MGWLFSAWRRRRENRRRYVKAKLLRYQLEFDDRTVSRSVRDAHYASLRTKVSYGECIDTWLAMSGRSRRPITYSELLRRIEDDVAMGKL